MRIGFDAKRAFTNNTGLGNYSRDTIRILSNFYKEYKFFAYTPIKTKNRRLEFIENQNNIFIRSPQNLIGNLLKSYWRSKSMVRDLFNNKIDIYHGLSHEIPLGIEKTNIKSVVTIHDLIYIRYPKLFSSIDRKIYDKKFRSSCARSNKIIAISKQTKRDIIDFFKIPEKKIQVIYQGCNKIFQKEISKRRKKEIKDKYQLFDNYLLYVGTIEERKNLLTLLKSLNNLPEYNLIIIGDGKSYMKKCQKYIKTNNLQKRTKFLSGLDIEEMAGIYQQAKMLIYPSIFEGFGIPIIEALFSKIPVITTKQGCFKEAGGPASIYIDPLSEDEITSAINLIENDHKLRKYIIEEGFKYVKKFSDEKIARNIMDLYTSLS
tara:strand:- start:11735 stop:12859 length:1125 start_codon:yes stop_codon:yes gene_type:complete